MFYGVENRQGTRRQPSTQVVGLAEFSAPVVPTSPSPSSTFQLNAEALGCYRKLRTEDDHHRVPMVFKGGIPVLMNVQRPAHF